MAYSGYSTNADLLNYAAEDAIVRLATDDLSKLSGEGGDGIADTDVVVVVEEMRQSADATIDSYLIGKYPGLRTASPVPSKVNEWSAILAVSGLFRRRQKNNEAVNRSEDKAISELKDARDGKLWIGLSDGSAVQEQSVNSYRTDYSTNYSAPSDSKQVFTDDVLEDL